MILVSNDAIERYTAAGLWGADGKTHSLDGLLRRNAADHADDIAVSDPTDKADWTGGHARDLTWRALNDEVTALSSFLQGLGLSGGSVVALYGGNVSEMIVATLATHRAGFIAAPVPAHWGQKAVCDYLTEIHARVIITLDRLEDKTLGLMCRAIAQDCFCVRFVFGFGEALPDGIVDLGPILASFETTDDGAPPTLPDPNAVATIHPTFLQTGDLEVTIPRSSNQWLSAAEALAEAMGNSDCTIVPFSLSGLVGFTAGLVASLKTAKPLFLHHYRTAKRLRDDVSARGAHRVLLPGELEDDIAGFNDLACVSSIVRVWKNSPAHQSGNVISFSKPDTADISDLTVLNQMVAIASASDGETPEIKIPVLDSVPEEPVRQVIVVKSPPNTLRAQPQSQIFGGELLAVGASVPTAFFPSNSEERALRRLRERKDDGVIGTQIAGNLDPSGAFVTPLGFLSDVVTVHGTSCATSDIDAIFLSHPAVKDAAYFPGNTGLGAAVVPLKPGTLTLEGFRDELASSGVCEWKLPAHLIEIDEIPRGVGDVVMRGSLLSLCDDTMEVPSGVPPIDSDLKKAG